MAPLLSTLPERIVFDLFFTLLGTSFVGMRLYVRYMHNTDKKVPRTKVFILSDIFMCIAWAFGAGITAVDIFQVNEERKFKNQLKGFQAQMMMANAASGGHARRAGPEMPPFVTNFVVTTLKCATFYWMAVPSTIGFIKFSFLCHFYNISKNIKVGAWAMLLFSTFLAVSGTLVMYFTNFFICENYTDNWDPTKSATCTGNLDIRNPVMITVSSLHLTADLSIMITAYLILSQTLNLKRNQWSAVLGIYTLALVTMVLHASYFGISMTVTKEVGTAGNNGSVDPAMEKMARWMICMSLAETNIGLVALTLPSLRVWFRSYGLWSRSGGASGSRSRGNTYEMGGSVHTGHKNSKWEASVITRSESETELASHGAGGGIMVTTQMEVGNVDSHQAGGFGHHYSAKVS